MLFLAALLSLASATTVTTDDDVYCDADAPSWFPTFAGEVMTSSLATLTPPTSQQAELDAYSAATGMDFSAAYMLPYWNVDSAAHTAIHDPPMRHCEVHYKCMEWAGFAYDFTPRPHAHNTFGETLGDNSFFTPMSAQALSCAYYYCAQTFYDVSDEGIELYEVFLSYLMRQADNGKINTDLDVSHANCGCNNALAAAYPNQNDADTLIAKISAGTCINDLEGGLQSGGWMWFCEKLSCITAIESKFTDYVTCTFQNYYDVDWEACPTNMQWVMQTYGIGYGGQFVTHLLTVFTLCFVSLIPFVLLYGACCGGRKSDNKGATGI
jgi:hypothetical protein